RARLRPSRRRAWHTSRSRDCLLTQPPPDALESACRARRRPQRRRSVSNPLPSYAFPLGPAFRYRFTFLGRFESYWLVNKSNGNNPPLVSVALIFSYLSEPSTWPSCPPSNPSSPPSDLSCLPSSPPSKP